MAVKMNSNPKIAQNYNIERFRLGLKSNIQGEEKVIQMSIFIG